MYNWSTDIKRLKKNSEEFKIWKLEQLINFGLDKDKPNEKDLKKYLNKLNIDPGKKALISLPALALNPERNRRVEVI